MRARSVLAPALGFVLAIGLAVTPAVGAESPQVKDKIPVDGTPYIGKMKVPRQPSKAEAAEIVAQSTTTESQCFGDDKTLILTIPSNDPANPGTQDVVFFRETDPASTGKATLWVGWDFLTTAYGREDVITCDQLAYLQGQLDDIVATDVHYFGAYTQRPAGNENIDILIYNIVDEDFYDPEFGSYIAGFFSVGFQEQFDRNIIFVDSLNWEAYLGNTPGVSLDPYRIEGTVAHELEHLIHNDHDIDEESFVDEGLAELAVYLNGFGHTGNTLFYLAYHRDSLTLWGSQLEDYGSSYLFQLYLLENFGSKTGDVWDNAWTLNMVDQPLNGIAGVEAQTGREFNDLFDAWILANLEDEPSVENDDGFPLGYEEIELDPFVSPIYGPWSIRRAIKDIYGADTHGNLPISRYYGGSVSGSVEFPLGASGPYAAIYKSYAGAAQYRSVTLRGDAVAGVAPVEGTYEVASGGGHQLTDRTLRLNAPVGGTLTFSTWFDIEEDWDYGFVEASTDNGASWEPLVGSITRTSMNPNASTAWANSLVAGQASTDAAITGNSGGWVDATVTLPAASGVLVRFNYYTDEAVNGQGWFIDDVAVDGFADGFESGSSSWSLGGWTVTTGLFANDWIVAYENPINRRGKPDRLELGYFDGTVGPQYEVITGQIDTSRLGNDKLIVAFANRPDESPFDAGYLLLVRKKG
jgi:hypothetical protein